MGGRRGSCGTALPLRQHRTKSAQRTLDRHKDLPPAAGTTRRHLPACRARGKPESAHHGPIKLHDRAGLAAGIARCKAPKSRLRSGNSLLRSAKKPRLRNCALSLIHIWTSRKYFVYLPLQRRVIATAVALLLFTKPAVGVFGGGIVKTKSDLVSSTKHLVETTRHLVLRRC